MKRYLAIAAIGVLGVCCDQRNAGKATALGEQPREASEVTSAEADPLEASSPVAATATMHVPAVVLFDGTQRISGMKLATDPQSPDNKVAFWEGAPKGFRLALSTGATDLSEYNALRFRFHSAEADNHGIVILCDSNGSTEGNYYHKKFVVDWKGWKTICIPFDDFDATRKPVGWHRITKIQLANSGYGGTKPNEDAHYCVDDVEAIRRAPPPEAAQGRVPGEVVELSTNNSSATFPFDIDPSRMHIYGISYELRGRPGAKARVRDYRTFDNENAPRQKVDIIGHHWNPIVSEGWESNRLEILTKKGSARLTVKITLEGDAPVRVRNVEAVRGGWPDDPPLPEAPYLDWIDSLKPNHAFARNAPLLRFKDGGGSIWDYRTRVVDVPGKDRKKMEGEVAPYLALSTRDLVTLMPAARPFYYHCGYHGWSHRYRWSPEEPDLLRDKKTGRPVDYLKQFPVHGREDVVAPSGKTVTYPYHDTADNDPTHKGRRIYLDEFMSSARINALSRAGYIMAGLYRKTGDIEYGARSAAILWAFARNAPDWPVVGQPGWNSPPKQKRMREPDFYEWFSQVYSGPSGDIWYVTSYGSLMWPARWYDLLRDTPAWDEAAKRTNADDPRTETASGLLHIARMMLRQDAYHRFNEFVIFHNLSGTAHRSLIQLGRSLGVPELVHYGLRKTAGAFRKSFMADGVFPESQWYTMDQVVRQKQALDALAEYRDPPGYVCSLDGTRLDVDDPKESITTYDRIWSALNRQTFPDGTALTVHDSWSDTANPPKSYSLKFAPRSTVRPHLFHAFGHGILGRGSAPHRIEAHLHYSGHYNHGHQDMLNLILWAYGDELVSDIGYTHISSYASSSVSHNLVVVDGMVQQTRVHAGNLLAWHARPGSTQVIQVDQGVTPAYPQCRTYRRSLLVLPFGEERNVVLDVFDVAGGSRHEWMANGCADYEQTVRSTLQPRQQLDTLAPDGKPLETPRPWGDGEKERGKHDVYGKPSAFYGAFRNAGVARMTTAWTATMEAGEPVLPDAAWAGRRARSRDRKPGLRLHWVGPFDGEAILAEAPRNRYLNELEHKKEASAVWARNRMPKIIVRRDGTDLESTFVAAWEPFDGAPFLETVTPIADLTGTGHGWTLEDGARRATVLYRPPESRRPVRASDLSGDGRFIIETRSPGGVTVDLYDGSRVETARLRASVDASSSYLVTGISRDETGYAITVSGRVTSRAHGREYVCFAQEGACNRWLQVRDIEAGQQASRLILADDPGFTFAPETSILRETCFPHRVMAGTARILLPSWMNVHLEKTDERIDIRLRASGRVSLTLRNVGREATAVRSRRLGEWSPWRVQPFSRERDDVNMTIDDVASGDEWLEVMVQLQ